MFSLSVVSNSLWSHGLQHTRTSWPSLSPESAQTCIHWVVYAIWSSHSLLPTCALGLKLVQNLGLFQWVFLCIRWPKYWSFSFNISPSNEYSRLISIRIDWFDLLAVQGILKSLWFHSMFYKYCILGWLMVILVFLWVPGLRSLMYETCHI